MDSLRLTLIIIGLIIIAGIYLRFRSSDDDLLLWLKQRFSPLKTYPDTDNSTLADEDELIPVLTSIDDEPDHQDFEELSQVISTRDRFEEYSKTSTTGFSAVENSVESGPESLLIILYIMSPKGHVFAGEGVHAVMTSAGLVHGEHQIYHYMENDMSVFSIANAIEPGYFELSQLQNTTTPGLAVFMQLPGPMECRKAFDHLIEISQRLAAALSGELCDEHRVSLSQQTITHLKEKVDAYRLKQQSAQRKKLNS